MVIYCPSLTIVILCAIILIVPWSFNLGSFIPKEGFIMNSKQFQLFVLWPLGILATCALFLWYAGHSDGKPDTTRLFSVGTNARQVVCGDIGYDATFRYCAGNDTAGVTVANLNPGLVTIHLMDRLSRDIYGRKPVRINGDQANLEITDNTTKEVICRWQITIDRQVGVATR